MKTTKSMRYSIYIIAALLLVGCSQPSPDVATQPATPSPTQQAQQSSNPPASQELSSLLKILSAPADITGDEWPQLTEAEQQAYLQAADKLSVALLEEGNSAATPLSMYVALSMLAAGADGETQQQICALLGLEAGELDGLNTKLMRICNNDIMRTVNSLYVQPGWPVEQDYMDKLSNTFAAWVNEADFAGGSASEQIAAWIAQQTEGMINPSLELDPNTVMALVNATLLQDEWADNFQPENIAAETFHAPGGDTQVDMMRREQVGINTWSGDGYRAILLPLKQADMLFLLPDEGIDPYQLLQRDGLSSLFNLDGKATPSYQHMDIGIPKFDIASSGSATDALKELGIDRAFDKESAEFAPMSSEQVWVGDVSQGTRVIVHEDGVAAAGYTVIGMAGAGAELPEQAAPFVLDRPFLFCLTRGGLPVFSGVVSQPNQPGSVIAPGPAMDGDAPVKSKQAIEQTITNYFDLLAKLDAEIKQAPAQPGDAGYSSDTARELEFCLQNQDLATDQQLINRLKLAYAQRNTEPAWDEFALEFGELSLDGVTAVQQLRVSNRKGSEDTSIVLSNWGGQDWYITDLGLTTDLLGQVEQAYYAHKADFEAQNTGYTPEQLLEYVRGKMQL